MTIGGAYEIALRMWGLTPDFINDNLTEELFALLFQKMGENLRRIAPAAPDGDSPNRMSEAAFLEKHSGGGISYVRC